MPEPRVRQPPGAREGSAAWSTVTSCRSPGCRSASATPRAHTRSLLLRDRRHRHLRGPRVRRLDRPLRLPELLARGDAGEPPMVPLEGRRRRRPSGHGPRTSVGRERSSNPFLVRGLMDLRPARGTLDLLPPQGSRMRALYDRAAALARLHGYRYVETPGFEATELFSATSGETSDVVTKEMYTFDDRKGRSLTLRPEGTAPVMRAYLGAMRSSRLRSRRTTSRGCTGTPGRRRSLPRAPAVRHRGVRDRGARRRRRGDRDGRRVPPRARAEPDRAALNSIGDEVCRPAYRDELVAFLRKPGPAARRASGPFRGQPLRVLGCKDEACRAVARKPRASPTGSASRAGPFEGVQSGLKTPASRGRSSRRWSAASTTTRGRRSSS